MGVQEKRGQGKDGGRSLTMDADQKQALWDAARRDFAAYYAAATPEDGGLLDDLVLARAAVLVLMNCQRPHVPAPIRLHLEKTSDAVDQLFAHFREAVRASATYRLLGEADQVHVQRHLFTVDTQHLV